jgi:hypothetical protein
MKKARRRKYLTAVEKEMEGERQEKRKNVV